MDTAMVEADTPVEAEVAKREDVAAPDATTTSRPKVNFLAHSVDCSSIHLVRLAQVSLAYGTTLPAPSGDNS